MEISVRQMYGIENAGHAMGFHKRFMMENAGAAAVRRLLEHTDAASKSVLVAAGMGNNGGDGLVAARHLAGYGARVTVAMMGKPSEIKTEECSYNYDILSRMPSVTLAGSVDAKAPYDIVVDALLGTGISGDIREPYLSAIEFINGSGAFVLAVDVPSGMDPDTGRTANSHVRADATVTFHRMKRGIPKRPDITGVTYAERIGIPPEAESGIVP